MSIFDKLGLSIFCRKMERMCPMREEMDGKFVYLPPDLAFQSFDIFMMKAFFPICTLTWRVNNNVSCQEKV